MKYKTAIFDLDGTLIDSTWIWAEICKKFNENFKREFIKDLITRSKQQQILVHNTTYTVDENDNIKKIGETTYELTRTNRNNKHNIRKNIKL